MARARDQSRSWPIHHFALPASGMQLLRHVIFGMADLSVYASQLGEAEKRAQLPYGP